MAGIKENTKSGLLLQVQRLLLKAKENNTLPKYLLLENVANLVSKRFIGDFNNWLAFLKELGYTSYWKILSAEDYGVPQSRRRVFVVSSLESNFTFEFKNDFIKKDWHELLEPWESIDEKYFKEFAYTKKVKEKITIETLDSIIDGAYWNSRPPRFSNVCPTFTTLGQKHVAIYLKDKGLRNMTLKEMWRFMGFKDEWIDKIKVSQFQQRKQAGNSICVNCLIAIFKELFN